MLQGLQDSYIPAYFELSGSTHVSPPLYAYPSKKSFVVVYTLKDPQCLSNAFQVLEKGEAQLSYRISAKSESAL